MCGFLFKECVNLRKFIYRVNAALLLHIILSELAAMTGSELYL